MNIRRKQNIIPLLAMAVLIIGSVSTLYVHATQSSQIQQNDIIIINDQTFDINTIFSTFTSITIETDVGPKTGLSLSQLFLSTNIDCPTCHSYIIKASDGYQQTVNWDDIQQGILTQEKRVYFPHLAHAFWVRNIIEIEVNNQ